jgi:hypothetical protein
MNGLNNMLPGWGNHRHSAAWSQPWFTNGDRAAQAGEAGPMATRHPSQVIAQELKRTLAGQLG